MHRAKTYMWHTYLPRPVEALVLDTLQWVVIRGSTNHVYGTIDLSYTVVKFCGLVAQNVHGTSLC